jgi:two-component system cell cycle response regulator CtrA
VELDLNLHVVQVNSQIVSLTRMEFSILELLFLRRHVVQDTNTLLNHLYAGVEAPEPKNIGVYVCRLRKKFAESGVPRLIDTVRGCGYILNAGINNYPARSDQGRVLQ